MQGQKMRPDFLGHGQLIGAPGFLHDINVNIRLGGQNLREDIVEVRVCPIDAGEGRSGTVRIGLQRVMQFLKSVWQITRAQKVVSIAPGNFRGSRVAFLGVHVGIARRFHILFQFIGGGEIEPRFGVMGIQSDSAMERVQGAVGMRIFEIKFQVATQAVPILRIARLQPRGQFEVSLRLFRRQHPLQWPCEWRKKTQRWRPLGPQQPEGPARGNRKGEESSEGNCA